MTRSPPVLSTYFWMTLTYSDIAGGCTSSALLTIQNLTNVFWLLFSSGKKTGWMKGDKMCFAPSQLSLFCILKAPTENRLDVINLFTISTSWVELSPIKLTLWKSAVYLGLIFNIRGGIKPHHRRINVVSYQCKWAIKTDEISDLTGSRKAGCDKNPLNRAAFTIFTISLHSYISALITFRSV